MADENGDRYVGAMGSTGLWHGGGTCHYASGRIAAGLWDNQVLNGQARVIDYDAESGDKMEFCGVVAAGVFSGAGVLLRGDSVYLGQVYDIP